MQEIKWICNKNARTIEIDDTYTKYFAQSKTKDIRNFHKSFPQYKVTPLFSLDKLARYLNVEKVLVKDESYRFGLNAFKVLGGSYAMGRYLSKCLGIDPSKMTFELLKSKQSKEKLGDITFITATDGNHGRGVAWFANQLGFKSVVLMPKGSAQMRVDNIAKEGADVTVTDLNYDDAVRLANSMAEKNGWIMVQDTAWEGYEDIPMWIMQGYSTIIDEVIEQLEEKNEKLPTHIFLQAGVGSFAGSVQGYITQNYGKERPITAVLEPVNAACIYKSAKMNDGKPHAVKGDLETIMAGLACGEPNIVGWNILSDYSDMYVSCPDYVAARGMRTLAAPMKEDPQIISGESGAVGIGFLNLILERDEFREIADALKLDRNSRVLVISTEGDTDPENFRHVVWDGKPQSR